MGQLDVYAAAGFLILFIGLWSYVIYLIFSSPNKKAERPVSFYIESTRTDNGTYRYVVFLHKKVYASGYRRTYREALEQADKYIEAAEQRHKDAI